MKSLFLCLFLLASSAKGEIIMVDAGEPKGSDGFALVDLDPRSQLYLVGARDGDRLLWIGPIEINSYSSILKGARFLDQSKRRAYTVQVRRGETEITLISRQP